MIAPRSSLATGWSARGCCLDMFGWRGVDPGTVEPGRCGGGFLTDQIRLPERRGVGIPVDSEQLILVDEADREIGYMDRARCHAGRGTLHRAFSLLIFNGNGELLLQQRSRTKRLWPLYWSNSCCSHPRRAE